VKTVEKIREEIVGIMYESAKINPTWGELSDFTAQYADQILAIEVGGEKEDCPECAGLCNSTWGCSFCSDTGKLTRPKTLKDLLTGGQNG
jgi:hypothetical protein